MTNEERQGFRERIEREANTEAERVLGELAKLRFDAHQVGHVLSALKLPVPPELAAFLRTGTVPDAATSVERARSEVAEREGPSVAQVEREAEALREEVGKLAEQAREREHFPPPLTQKPAAQAVAPPAPKPQAAKPPEVAKPDGAPPAAKPKRVMTYPGIEAVPENLRDMPAAKGGGPVKARIAAAEGQRKVYDAVLAADNVVSGEVAKTTGLPADRVSAYLRLLEEAKLIRRTGNNRHDAHKDRSKSMGRASVEYAPLAEPQAEAQKAEPEPSPSVRVSSEVSAVSLAAVRDFAVGQKGMFSPHQVHEATKVGVNTATAALKILEVRGIVSDESPSPDMPLYAYAPPKSAGRAAELDAARGKAASATAHSSQGSDPVAGTGKPIRAANQEVQGLINAAQREGAVVRHAPNGHFEVRLPESLGGKKVLISATPRNPRSVMNDRARLRRAGLFATA